MVKYKSEEMRSFRCQLHWGSFAGHCFKCGELGHFMAECQQMLAGQGPKDKWEKRTEYIYIV